MPSRILLIEDHASLATALVRLLETRGVTAVHCHGVEAAVQAVREERWEAVISDLWIAGSPAAETVLKAMRAGPSGSAPFLLMTGGWTGGTGNGALRGIDGVIEKPFTFPEFLEQLERHVPGLAIAPMTPPPASLDAARSRA